MPNTKFVIKIFQTFVMMKKTLILALFLIIGTVMSAQPNRKGVPTLEAGRIVSTFYADYAKYEEEGFLISPYEYTEDFDGLGELRLVIAPALIEVQLPSVYSGGAARTVFDYETIPYDELVQVAVEEARKRGADALVSFSIELRDLKVNDPIYKGGACGRSMGDGYTQGYMYHIKGYCIKRKQE